MSVPFSIVVAVDEKFGIGKDGRLPWHLTGDLKHFRELTTQGVAPGKKNAVIMGRKTWESLPDKYRPLPNRVNIVLSRRDDFVLGRDVLRASSLDDALKRCADRGADINEVFVIGGAQVYVQSIKHPLCQKIHMTKIEHDFGCNLFFPKDLSAFKASSQSPLITEGHYKYIYLLLIRHHS